MYAYLEDMDAVSVRKSDFSPGFEASRNEALIFLAAGCVEGVGTSGRLKFLRLLCTPEEAEALAETEARKLATADPRKIRKQMRLVAMDVLQRMATARKFIFREQLSGTDGQRSGKWVFSHKQPVEGFGGVRWQQ